MKTPYDINFRANVEWRVLCTKTLKHSEVKLFEEAVENEYYYEMFLDGLPFWGLVGDVEKEDLLLGHTADSHHYIYTHLHFNISYNDDRIVAVSVQAPASYRIDITSADELDVQFSYRVTWTPTNDRFEDRTERYVKMHFLPKSFEIHWLSIVNSFVLVILLTAFLAIILMRVLKNDFTRYMSADEEEDLGEEESGWKLIHGDVFRFPAHPMFFSAAIGVGGHLFAMTTMLLGMALLSVFTPTKRGAILTASIVLYSLTSGVGGYLSARLYRQLGGTNWVWNAVLTAVFFPLPFTVVFSVVNTAAVLAHSTAALPFGTVMIILLLYCLVAFPLTVIGAIAGRNTAGDFEAPCRTNQVARQIPDVPWYRRAPAQMFIAGFLPFSAIYIELHYIFASVWGHKIYTLFGILFVAFIMLLIVTSFITIALTYFQLAIEDHRWWWRSFVSGGSSGLFVLAYSFFYYFERSEMSGYLQTTFFFGYMVIISFAFALMLGFVGFFSSLCFVKHIYRAIKAE